jgi:flagellar hook-associated protein 1 FlgK
MAVAISESMNTQHRLGLTLDGQVGGNLFTPIALADARGASTNVSGATIALAVSDPTQLAASNYEITFTAANAGTVQRVSDGKYIRIWPGAATAGLRQPSTTCSPTKGWH